MEAYQKGRRDGDLKGRLAHRGNITKVGAPAPEISPEDG
jgi:hypothetical protein